MEKVIAILPQWLVGGGVWLIVVRAGFLIAQFQVESDLMTKVVCFM